MQKKFWSQQVFSNNILIQKLTQAVLRSSFKHHPNKTHQTLSRYYPSSRQTHLNADLIQTSSKVDKISYELIRGYINNLVSLEKVLFQIQLGNQIGGRSFWGEQQSQQVCFLVQFSFFWSLFWVKNSRGSFAFNLHICDFHLNWWSFWVNNSLTG